ncbi:MAG: hypothetical protein K9N01_00185 [Cephaloticoccus sp.]|nr:hypothetical protein [Cephaloticoccus sp.]
MNRKYILPGIIALVLHAMLLLGSKSDPVAQRTDFAQDKPDLALLVTEPRFDPPVIELEDQADEAAVVQGVTNAQNPT